MLLSKDSLAGCFIVCENWSSVFEKYWHKYVTVLYPLREGSMSIIACQAFKLTWK